MGAYSRILLPWDSQPQEPTGVNRDWPYADGLIFAATGGLPDAVGGYLPSLIGSTGFSAGVDGVSFDSTSTSSQGWFYTLPSNHPLYSITTVVTIVQIVEIDSWGSYGCLLSVPHAAGSWSSPFDAMGIQKNAANNQVRLWGSSTEHVCTLTVTTGRNVLGVTRSAGNSVFYVNGTTQAVVGNSGAYDFTNKQPICLMQRSNSSNGEGTDGRSPLLLIFNKFYSEAQLRDIVQTAWQAFAPRSISVPVSAGGGGTNLTIQDATHAHSADSLTLTLGYTNLTIADATHGHTADSLALTVDGTLAIQDATHAHTADNLSLSVTGATDLTIQEATHGQSADNLALTLGYVDLLIQDATHGHTADNVTLGGLYTDLELILKILSNRQELNAGTGTFTIYDDDSVSVLFTASAWADAAGTVPYSGGTLGRIDALA